MNRLLITPWQNQTANPGNRFAPGRFPSRAAAVLLILLMTTVAQRSLQACNTCGCSASGTDFGMLQTWGLHTIGMQYRLDRFDNGFTDEGLKSSDFLSTWNLNGIWSPSDRWQLQAQIPLRLQTRVTGQERNSRFGPGDSWVVGRYALWVSNPDSADTRSWISLGGGLKLPTGEFRPDQDNQGLPVNSQLGTGSVDFLAELRAQVSREAWSFQAEAAFRYNLENAEEYRFGQQVTGALDARWYLPDEERRFGLLGGLYGEYFGKDSQHRYWRNDTGGRGLFATAGAFGSIGSWSAAIRYRAPLAQEYADGKVKALGPADVNLTYRF